MEILVLLLLFQIKHWYADFKIQTYMQTVKKGVWLDPIGMTHTRDHMLASLIVLLLFSFLHPLAPLTMLAVVAIEGIYHYLVDYIKVRYGSKDHTTPLYWNQFGLDQMAHQISYLIIALYLVVI
jgi:Protein of unknown function (DUF3307)